MFYLFINSFDYFSRITVTSTYLSNELYCLSLLGRAHQKYGSDTVDRTSPALGILLTLCRGRGRCGD